MTKAELQPHDAEKGQAQPAASERLEPLGEVRSFVDPRTGERRHLTTPDGEPSRQQLLALWRHGMLAIVHPDAGNEFTRAEAAWAIDWVREAVA